MEKVRKSNFELLRIISMYMIVLWHVTKNNIDFTQTPDIVHLFLVIIICISVVHVNSYVMISGFFSTKKTTTWKKTLSLIGKTWVYKVVIAIILFLTTSNIISELELLKEFFPLDLAQSYWFINRYIVLLLLIPYINILINKLTEKQYKNLLLTSFVLFSVIPLLTSQLTISNDGFNILHFIYIYLIGAYFAKFPLEDNYHFKNFSKNKLQIFLIITFFLCVFFEIAIYYLSLNFQSSSNLLLQDIGTTLNNSIYCYSSPIVIIQTIAYFLFFKTLNIENKLINKIASLTFGIYLFHENYYLKKILYKPFQITKYFDSKFLMIDIFIIALIIFTAGLLVETIRKLCAKIPSKIKWIQIKKEKALQYIENI